MIIILCFILGFGYAALRKQQKEVLNILKIIDHMDENDVDEKEYDTVLNALEKINTTINKK